jgi:TRAP-type C4-dicarboxylate transport system substrate-binding protein
LRYHRVPFERQRPEKRRRNGGACPGEVDAGSPTKACARQTIWEDHMRMRYTAAGAALAAIAVMAPGSQVLHAEGAPIVMKLATATLNDGQHEWMKRFAATIESKSGGRIKAELYPASQLGAIPRMIEGTQLGSIQIFISPPEFFVGVDQRFELLSAAGLADNEQHAVKIVSDPEFAKAFLAVGANKGLIGASLFIGGPAAFAMRTPFRTLADIKAKKIRVFASPFQIDQITRLGGTGVPMSLGDVLPALQQGTIDGALGALQVFTALRYYDTAKYQNETGHSFVFSFAAMSKRWFDTLPADLQDMVMTTARETSAEVNPWEIDFLARQRKIWVDKGGVLDTLTPADKAELLAKTGTIGDDIVKTKPELAPLWQLLQATVKRTR